MSPGEDIESALIRLNMASVQQVVMVIQMDDSKINVSFDFERGKDTAIMVAQELLEAGIAPRDVPMTGVKLYILELYVRYSNV